MKKHAYSPTMRKAERDHEAARARTKRALEALEAAKAELDFSVGAERAARRELEAVREAWGLDVDGRPLCVL